MSTNNKKSIASQALLEMNSITESIKEESKNIIKDMLSEVVKDMIRESVEDDEKEYDVVDDNESTEDVDETEPNDSNEEETVETETEVEDENGEESDLEQEVDAQEAPEEDGEGEDEWSEYSQYQVGDNTYDLTGEKDYDQIVKVYKLMRDEDQVVVKKDGDKVQLQDNGTGAEYVIDLGGETEDSSSEEGAESEEMTEGRINEGFDDEPAGFDDEFTEDDLDSFDDDSDSLRFEGKKSKKTMKESKKNELVLEVDLGYTDNYQDKDPIKGLSNNEPSKSGKSWEKGVPTGTEKPWAGDSKDKGEPFEKTVNEEENVDECGGACMNEEPVVDEGTNVGGAVQQRTSSKSHIPDNRKEHGPKVKRHVSAGGNYEEVVEAYKKENKALKENIIKLREGLENARVTNFNLAKITKLFLENTVTRQEKVDIVNRFSNEAKTIEQSKALYESIDKELKKGVKQNLTLENTMESEKPSINESIKNSKGVLSTLDLIKRIENC